MRQFLKYTLASLTGSILFCLLLGSLLTLGAVGLVGVIVAGLGKEGDAPTVEKDTVLVYDLSTVIPDSPEAIVPSALVFGTQSPSELTLRQAVLALEEAATDDRITALYLKGSTALGTGLASQTEMQPAIAAFQAAGKPILAYDISWSEREYAVASLADTVYLNPFGEIEMNGLYAETMYQADALEKLGVGVQVTRVGRYKSAVEPLIRDTMSPEEREQTQRLLADVWQNLLTAAAAPRDLSSQQLQTIANTKGFLFGAEAETQKLADAIAYEDEVITALRELTGEENEEVEDSDLDFRQISLAGYAATVDDPLTSRRSDNQVALVYAEGPIIDGGDGDFSQTGTIEGNTLARQLRQLRQDDEVKAVVLRVNSPGGSATASEVILREVQLLRKAGKPVVVSMGNVAASGGYWIASQADAILAQPTTITGSIGVYGIFLNLEELGTKVGVNWDGVKTSELADIFSSTRPKTAAELAILQRSVDTIYDSFLDRVAEGRDLTRPAVAELAQGRVWSGQTALDLGLVDELGGVNDAIATAADLAELGDDWRLQEYPEPSELQRFLRGFFSTEVTQAQTYDPLTTQVLQFVDDTQILRTLNDPRGIYLLMPNRFVVK
ncbi:MULTISPECIES: signal peptide peptidase SppA [Cyanophyceae]|uniref:signal peptide peptidase SppA n=1 Tax=Cyanophyceae TaxID=3028117 RepID=UPI0016896CCE|nr:MULTISPECIES: signal peptide peptidase SppA [Cyanophyceae]MBD1918569.1 signal peptide peptidase SppA [Phormidium sp. FACHB-77]MBD2031458.1 signal peptide peptidase SppA [Phormidium sp. FACHB-322]MBD2049577.1 signal peptide peptidase SppA [Leptolyngbya sp. FACHB-60]